MAVTEEAPSRIATLLSRISPVPAFPEYTGRYKVGSVDAELPVDSLESPVPTPAKAGDIATVQFRVFYPAVDESAEKRISWLPKPRRQHVSAYTQFVGLGPWLSDFLALLPRHLYCTSIPVHSNARLRQPETNSRWPTVIFSHGLGGSRHMYSYIAGSLASHGIVVFCPEHRDGSAVVSHIRHSGSRSSRQAVRYVQLSHKADLGVYRAREAQLRIRLWELGLVHDAVLALDDGRDVHSWDPSTADLKQFTGRLDVQEPGRIIFAGHSFGAATIYQLLKCVYYAGHSSLSAMAEPLFAPGRDSRICGQVTERTVAMLLDMWCLPLLAPDSAPLLALPLPAYADVPTAPGGKALLAVESHAFYKWTSHLHSKALLLSPEPSARVVTAAMYERPSGVRLPEPNFFYVVKSAHLSQSDFGILFPWLSSKIFSAEDPERALRLNLRAQLQLLRTNGFTVARTSVSDLMDGPQTESKTGVDDDEAILDRGESEVVDHWRWIDLVGLGDKRPVGESEEQLEVELDEQAPASHL
ncbi:phospholipase A2 [Ophiocordyceps camponoti-floridani]|uniref:Putative phospholipase n=1 Tax=Ophiocordyceps camponoti-floridani TaxID=2030778 RepID=A0A8H4Q5I0_9HYPO|nr:phospholipase A2 [Ophiocordyceps camponoti-floridani]